MSASIARAAGRRPELVADSIPLLDVAPYLAGAPGALAQLGAELRWAFENVGFYYLRGHGIPPSLIDATFAQAARFHALPLEEKLAVAVNADNVGYLPMKVGQFPGREEAAALSLTPHTDSGFMTLLAPNPVPGLSILLPDGRWIDAPAVPDAFVVNGGDILHRWTNERFLSTPHRVRNVSGQLRYAVPFFCDPNHDTLIDCVPSCRSAANPPKYPPIKFGDYAIWFARKSYEHMAQQPALADAEIAPGSRATMRW